MTAVLNWLRAAWQIDDVMVFSALTLDYDGQFYHIEAHARYGSIEHLRSGYAQCFSTEGGAKYYELAREAFDGFEWDLTTVFELIASCKEAWT